MLFCREDIVIFSDTIIQKYLNQNWQLELENYYRANFCDRKAIL